MWVGDFLLKIIKIVREFRVSVERVVADTTMFETILGAIFIIGLFVFTVYGLPKLGFRVRGKRFDKTAHFK